MSYSWFIFGREMPSFRNFSPSLRVNTWPGAEDPRDWEDLTSQLDFKPEFWAEVVLQNGGVPREVWHAHEILVRRIADAMHGVALTEDASLLHIADRRQPMPQAAFDGWLADLMATARRAAELRRSVEPAAMPV